MLVTFKKLEANRRNAQKSTGPRTPDGKATSSHNRSTPEQEALVQEIISAVWRLSRLGNIEAGQLDTTVAQTLSLPRRRSCRRMVAARRARGRDESRPGRQKCLRHGTASSRRTQDRVADAPMCLTPDPDLNRTSVRAAGEPLPASKPYGWRRRV